MSDIAYLTATQFAKYYGERYVSSNVQIYNNASGQYENIANQYRYFTTAHGLRIMAFGVLYDFTGNSNASKVIPAKTMIQQPWFHDAVNYTEPIDLFLLIGHNPLRNGSGSTIGTVLNAIRNAKPDTPIQVFGGKEFFPLLKVRLIKRKAIPTYEILPSMIPQLLALSLVVTVKH